MNVKVIVFLIIVIVTSVVYAQAGAIYRNDTGKIAYGLRIVFEAPVVITSYATVFPSKEPEGEAREFIFSGGTVRPGGTFWLSWQPGDVSVVKISWIISKDFNGSDVERCKFNITLETPDGKKLSAVIIREKELQTLPFMVKYTIQTIAASVDSFKWQVSQSPSGVHYKTFPIKQMITDKGKTAVFVFFSNRPVYNIQLTACDGNNCYRWTDTVENIFYAGRQIKLNLKGRWEQIFVKDQNSMLYITNQICEISSRFGTTMAIPRWPGNYHFVVQTEEGNHEVEAYILLKPSRKISVRGVFFADYYGIHPPGTRNIDINVMKEALEYVKSLNANTVGLVNFAGLIQVSPRPLLRLAFGGPSISGKMLQMFINMAKNYHFKIYLSAAHFHQSPYWTTEENQEMWSIPRERSWYKDYFYEHRRFVKYNLSIIDPNDIDYLMIWGIAGPLYIKGYFEKYRLSKLCIDLIDNVKQEFPGNLGWGDPHPEHANTHLNHCDFVSLRIWSFERFNKNTFTDPSNPTVPEIAEATKRYFRRIWPYLPANIPIFGFICALSEDMQNDFIYREPFPKERMDLQEQVVYLEGFFRAIYETPWITGILAWNINWFPEWAMPEWETTYSNWNFRGKPAEEVIRLWYRCLKIAD